MKRYIKAMMAALALLLSGLAVTASPASASGGTTTVDPEGTGSNWSHGTYSHMVTIYIDYPKGDPTPQRVKLNWNKSVGGEYMCLVPSGPHCTSAFGVVGKYTVDYSESNVAVSAGMGGYWQFAGDGPWGTGRRLLLAFYPHNMSVEPSHGENVALRVQFMDGFGNWLGWNSQVVSVN